MPADITKTSKAPDTTVVKQGQTTNRAFGSDPNAKVKGSRPTSDIPIPSTGR